LVWQMKRRVKSATLNALVFQSLTVRFIIIIIIKFKAYVSYSCKALFTVECI